MQEQLLKEANYHIDLEKAARTKPETPDELHAWIQLFTGYSIPRKKVCEEHNAPFEMLSHGFFETVLDMIVLANRTGGKTLNTSILNFLEMWFKPDCGVVSVGGSEKQAKRCYDYTVQHWSSYSTFEDSLAKAPTQSKTWLNNGSTYEVLSASEKSVHSPHVPKLRGDEIELMERKVFSGMLSIPVSKKGIRASTILTSTRFKAYGLMSEEWDKAEEKGYHRLMWCIWDVMEPCRDRVCSTCKLDSICQGKCKKAEGFYMIDDFISKLMKMDQDTLDSQWLCRKPQRKGLVYGTQFDENVHLVNIGFNPELPLHIAWDFGVSAPTAIVFVQKYADKVVIIDELYTTDKSTPEVWAEVVRKCKDRGYSLPSKGICDSEGADQILVLKRHCGFKGAFGVKKRDIQHGIDLIRAALRPVIGKPTLYVNGANCPNFLMEMRKYHYKEQKKDYLNECEVPEDAFDHGMDAIRYYFEWIQENGSKFIELESGVSPMSVVQMMAARRPVSLPAMSMKQVMAAERQQLKDGTISINQIFGGTPLPVDVPLLMRNN